uniref:MerR family transcriptional regulator n=1 Tax=Herbidospora sakaeratensis TaxID=564415 RepID=UPI0007846BAA|nr:MerR family transcriptional regulator [Herbidospora sakaeratensis]
MKIGDLAAKTGVAPRLLRYYEEVGILHPYRSGNGYRAYGEPAVERVLQIRELLESGFTTDMIREILPCLDDPRPAECVVKVDLDALRRQLGNVERRIDVLQRNRDAIKTYLQIWEETSGVTSDS